MGKVCVRRVVRTLGLATLGIVVPSSAVGQDVSWSSSVQYTEGKYIFTETTRSYSLYSAFTLQRSRFRLSLGLPVVVQDSRAVTYVGELPIPTGGPDHGVVANKTRGEPIQMGGGRRGAGSAGATVRPPSGRQTTDPPADSVEAPGSMEFEVADPVVSGGLQLVPARGRFLGLDLTGSVKIPLRDLESGVGTGELDAGLGMSAAGGEGRLMLFGDVGWWRYGDLPDLELKDVFTYGAGVGVVMGSSLTGLVSFSGSTQVIEAVESPAEIHGLVSYGIGDVTSISIGCGFGLTEASPDASLSIGTRITLLSR